VILGFVPRRPLRGGSSVDVDSDDLEVNEPKDGDPFLGERPLCHAVKPSFPPLLEVPVVDGDDMARFEAFGQSVTIW
jgi:hypothetical protein